MYCKLVCKCGEMQGMGMRYLERVRYVTAHYEDLQGLVWVPFGVLLAVAGLLIGVGFTPEAQTRLAGDLLALGGGAIVIGLIVSRLLIERHYQRRFGRVMQIESAFFRRWQTYLLVALPLLAVMFALQFVVLGEPEFSLFGFFSALGAGEAASWWYDRRFRGQWLVTGAVLASCGAAGFAYELARAGPIEPTAYMPLLFALLSVHLLVGGVLDHRLLTRTMKDVPEEDLG